MKCAIVDVGSNTIRLSIYHWEGQNFKLLLNKKEMAGLAGYIKQGILSDSGIQVACRVLNEFKALLENFDITDLRVFGTASLRNIANTEQAIETIEKVTGIQVDVISGDDEAAFSFLGATMGGNMAGHGLLADVGGGSTELVTYRDGRIISGRSLPMGSLSLFSKYVTGLFPTKPERKAIRSQVQEELKRMNAGEQPFSHLTGVGGTFRAVVKLCNNISGANPNNRQISADEIRKLYKELKKADQGTLRQILRLTPDRVHTILPGLVILIEILDTYQVDTVSLSTCGVREGYLMRRVMMKENSHDE